MKKRSEVKIMYTCMDEIYKRTAMKALKEMPPLKTYEQKSDWVCNTMNLNHGEYRWSCNVSNGEDWYFNFGGTEPL